MTASKLLIRTDASLAKGLGHLMRCRALAGEWRARGGTVTFLVTSTPPEFVERVRKDGCEVVIGPSSATQREELVWLILTLRMEPQGVLVLDGYQFNADYQRAVGSLVKRLICLDDVPDGKRRFECDVLLNQNHGVRAEDYASWVLPKTTLLLGPSYALLSAHVKRHAGSYRVPAKLRRILVTLGGADPADHTARILRELAGLPDLEIDVVLGALYPHADPGSRPVGVTPRHIRVHWGLDGLLDLARQADLAVTAAGSTVWEFACLGLPMIVVGVVDNQAAILRGLRDEQAAIVLGQMEQVRPGAITEMIRTLLAAPPRLQALSQSASRLVDGQGAARVVDALLKDCVLTT